MAAAICDWSGLHWGELSIPAFISTIRITDNRIFLIAFACSLVLKTELLQCYRAIRISIKITALIQFVNSLLNLISVRNFYWVNIQQSELYMRV